MQPSRTIAGLHLRQLTLAVHLAVAGLAFASLPQTASAQAAKAPYNIPAGPLSDALSRFAQQAGVAISFDSGSLRGVQTGGLQGSYDVEEGFGHLLRSTGYTIGRTSAGYVITPAPAASSGTPPSGTAGAEVLPTIKVTSAQETANGPVRGLFAQRSASATKTDTPILETPQSISVVTREEMDSRKTDTLADALEYTAGFGAQPNGFSRVADDFTLRGFNVGAGTGGILRDGMKLQSSIYDGTIEPYGLERVEVVKGAASVLYGQLSPGGLVNTVSKLPTDSNLREVGVSVGSHDRKQLTADIGGPLDDKGVWSWRLTALARDSGTDIDYVNDNKRYVAPAVTWRPTSSTTVTALASWQQIRSGFAAPLAYNITTFGNNNLPKVQRGQFIGEPGFDRFDSDMYSVGYILTHEFSPNVKVRHALRRFSADVEWNYLTAGTSINPTGNLTRGVSVRREQSTGTTSDTNVEWKLTTGKWQHTLLAGVDTYNKTYTTNRYGGTASSINVNSPIYGSTVVPNFAVNNGSDLDSRQAGFYFQEQAKFNDQWVVVAGLRHDRAESTTRSLRTGATAEKDDSKTTGRAGLVYLAPNGLAPYISYSQSFYPQDGVARDGSSFVPTEGEQVEVGVRWQPVGSETLISIAAYRLKQDNALTVDPVNSLFSVQTGQVRSNGLEIEAKHAVTKNLSVRAAYTYTDAYTSRDNNAALVGRRTQGVPRHTASLWTDYKLAGLGLTGWKIGGGVRAQDATMTMSPGVPTMVSGFYMFDMLIGYAPNANWDFTVRVQNLTDREYLYCNTACRYGNERTAVATLNYRW